MQMRGVRGATVAKEDSPEAILSATGELLEAILDANPSMHPDDLTSIFFTVTDDLRAAYPARAVRDFGWHQVPLMCAREIPVPGSLARCIRVLIHWNTGLLQSEVRHIYLGAAAELRPDWSTADS